MTGCWWHLGRCPATRLLAWVRACIEALARRWCTRWATGSDSCILSRPRATVRTFGHPPGSLTIRRPRWSLSPPTASRSKRVPVNGHPFETSCRTAPTSAGTNSRPASNSSCLSITGCPDDKCSVYVSTSYKYPQSWYLYFVVQCWGYTTLLLAIVVGKARLTIGRSRPR